ncbi:hypothetical protein NUACC26_000050 [Scytonema sp. NUACC26]
MCLKNVRFACFVLKHQVQRPVNNEKTMRRQYNYAIICQNGY